MKLLFINGENSVTGKPRVVVYIVDTAWTFEVTSTGELELVHERQISFEDTTASLLRERTEWDVYREYPELRAFLEEQYNIFATVPTGEVWVRELGSSPSRRAKGSKPPSSWRCVSTGVCTLRASASFWMRPRSVGRSSPETMLPSFGASAGDGLKQVLR